MENRSKFGLGPVSGVSESAKLEWDEIWSKFPAVSAIVATLTSGVRKAQEDGKITGQELGALVGSVSEKIGVLVDEAIADAKD